MRLAALVAMLFATLGMAAFAAGYGPPKPLVGPIPTALPNLTRGAGVGTLVALDPRSAEAEFRLSCGRYVPSNARIRPGLFRIDLRRASFGEAVNYNARGGGHVVSISLRQWETLVIHSGWHGTLFIKTPNAPRSVFLTNGGATDVCSGVFG